MTYDLVIKNGTVIDPSQDLHARRDIAIAGGRIVAVEKHVSDNDTHDVIEADGLLVLPGLVDSCQKSLFFHLRVYFSVVSTMGKLMVISSVGFMWVKTR